MIPKIKFKFFAILFSFLCLSCGTDTENSSFTRLPDNKISTEEPCSLNAAVLSFHDGSTQVLCGCQESNKIQTFQSGERLRCTIKKNSAVTFLFKSKNNKIKLTDHTGLGFPESSIYDPQTEKPLSTFAYKFTQTGTFSYKNIFNSLIFGQIIVQE